MRIGLTYDEFVELRSRNETFPMRTSTASSHLRWRGYDCQPAMLELLVTNLVVILNQPDAWTREDVDAAAEHFEQSEIFTPLAAMCQAFICRYVDFLRPLREASRAASEQYGSPVPAEDQYFVMHRVPPRCVPDGDSHRVENVSLAVISFSLCDDIREQLERGKEV